MKYFSEINRQVLNTLKSNTLSDLSDNEIDEILNLMLFRAIAAFRFPQVSLEYKETEDKTDYEFLENITQREVNVILVLVKLYWLEQQLDNENRFEDIYYDKDVKTYSRGNLLKNLNDRYMDAKKEAKSIQYEYSRVKSGLPALGMIYDE